MSVKKKRAKWPESSSGHPKKTTLRVVHPPRGANQTARSSVKEQSPAELWSELGDVTTELVEKAGSVVGGKVIKFPHPSTRAAHRKKAA